MYLSRCSDIIGIITMLSLILTAENDQVGIDSSVEIKDENKKDQMEKRLTEICDYLRPSTKKFTKILKQLPDSIYDALKVLVDLRNQIIKTETVEMPSKTNNWEIAGKYFKKTILVRILESFDYLLEQHLCGFKSFNLWLFVTSGKKGPEILIMQKTFDKFFENLNSKEPANLNEIKSDLAMYKQFFHNYIQAAKEFFCDNSEIIVIISDIFETFQIFFHQLFQADESILNEIFSLISKLKFEIHDLKGISKSIDIMYENLEGNLRGKTNVSD